MTDDDLTWLTSETLLGTVLEEPKLSLRADVHRDGTLERFGAFDGRHPMGWVLTFAHGRAEGRATLAAGSGGSADYEVYSEGTAERFDAWSDGSEPKPVPYREWVECWIRSIIDAARTRVALAERAEETKVTIAKLGKRAVIKPVK